MKRNPIYFKGTMISDNRIWPDTLIEIQDGVITYVGKFEGRNPPENVINVADGYICPGYIDTHIHGINGFDFMDSHIESFYKIQKGLTSFGITSFLATSRTQTVEKIKRFISYNVEVSSCPDVGSNLLGIHLEGPWISERFKGAQKSEHLLTPTLQSVKDLFNLSGNLLKIVTIAPELHNSLQVIEFLTKNGVAASAGHTDASFREIENACKVGLSRVSHCFNAMRPIHHRELTTAFAALYLPNLHCEIIADGHHIHPKMIELLYKNKGADHITLISDCTGANHLDDGFFEIGDKLICKKDGKITLADGTLAGSALTLNEAVKFAVLNCNIPLEHAVQMATFNPAKAIGVGNRKGRIKEGYDADLIVLSSRFDVECTMISGKIVYQRENQSYEL